MIKTAFSNLIFVSLVWFGSGVGGNVLCPPGCFCNPEPKFNGSYYVNCANLGLKKPINPNDLPANVYQLDLSGNEIQTIVNYAFRAKNSTRIKRLDLSRNGLKKIAPNAFAGLSRLTKIILRDNSLTTIPGDVFKKLRNVKNIDLSENNLLELNKTQFSGCKDLRLIDLSSNKLSLLPDGLFTSLSNLKKINLQQNPLICDCNLKWMVKWLANLKSKSQGLFVFGRCKHPFSVKEKKIELLNKKEMVCENLKLPVMSFGPKGDEIAFNGDSYSFECKFTWIPHIQMTWYKDNQQLPLNPHNKHRNVLYKLDTSQVVLSTTVEMKGLNVEDSGQYSCIVNYPGGYQFTRSSHLSVIPTDAPFCHAETTITSKGTFQWHDTAAGGAAFLPCPLGIISKFLDHRDSAIMARRNCSVKGHWLEVEAEPCVHANEITRALYDLKEKAVNDSTVASVSEQLMNISSRATEFSHPLDVVYAAEIVDNLGHAIGRSEILNDNLVKTVSNIMETDEKLLRSAQERSKACSSMVLQLIALHSRFPSDIGQIVSYVSENIATYLIPIKPNYHVGNKMCFVDTGIHSSFTSINCLPCKDFTSCEKQMAVDTSVYLPSSWYSQISSDENSFIQFSVFSNSKLFPQVKKRSESGQMTVVTSSVVSLQFGGIKLTNVSKPLPVIFKLKNQQKGKQPLSVYWNFSANGGFGSWKENVDCSQVSFQGNSTVTKCLQRVNSNIVAVMMNVSKPGASVKTAQGARFLKSLHGAMRFIVFAAAGIASLLILITMVTYAVLRELRFDRDDAAMLMNECLALLVTIVVFVSGINQVSNKLVCRSVGVLLHYFVLSSLLWIGCSGICLNRLIRTAIKPEEYNPVLRYYMTSWGIPLIICGITIAGNVENYQVEDYCLLRSNPFYGAFLGPACLIVLIDVIIFLRLSNLIRDSYDTNTLLQMESEGDGTETVAEENALVIQQNTSPSGEEENVGGVDKSALPDRVEMDDLLRGNCVILLVIVANIALGILLIRYRRNFALYITFHCLLAVALIVLGVVIFFFHCFKKERFRFLWRKISCKCRCLLGKRYETEGKILQADDSDDIPANITAQDSTSGGVEQFPGEEIHGAKNLLSIGDGDSLSNVSLPSSAAITLNKQVVDLPEKELQVEKAASVSDKQSWASAPLPLQYKPRGKLLKKSASYRHSYTEKTCSTPTIEECRKAPLAPPEGTASSIQSSLQIATDTASNVAPSDGPASARDAVDTVNKNVSCSASEVSIPLEPPITKNKPPVPGLSSHGSEGVPPLPHRKTHPAVPEVRDSHHTSRPPGIDQELIDHYSIPVGANNIPRQIPRDHVVVRERYHIPYEPRAVSEKPRDHYRILPLPRSGREHYLAQPGRDQYDHPRDQPSSPNLDNQYQAAPEESNPGQPNCDVNQVPTLTHRRPPYEYYRFQYDSLASPRAQDLCQRALDQISPRLHDNYQVPHEQSPAHGQPGSPTGTPRLHEYSYISPENVRPRSPDPNEPSLSPRSSDHSRVAHDASFARRPRGQHHVVPLDHVTSDQPSDRPYEIILTRDNVRRDQFPSERLYEIIQAPSDQSSVPRTHEPNENECFRDLSQTPHDQNVINESARVQVQESVERPRDQYAGEGPREPPQAINPDEKSTSTNQRPGVSVDQNASRPQNGPSGSREQPKGIRVSRRRSRNPYQIARDIHQNLGIETRPRDRQSRRQHRTPPADHSSQPTKTYNKLPVSSTGDTPKERTPRSSMSSWKEDRQKSAKKEWTSDMPKPAVFVPLPHLKRSTPEPPRNETSV